VLLIGEVLEDPRVYRTCMSLSECGAKVTVACTNPSYRPERETFHNLSIIRFPHRTEFFLKRLYNWLQGRLHTEIGQALARGHEDVPVSSLKAAIRNFALDLNFAHFIKSSEKINRKMLSAFITESFDLIHSNDVDTLFAGRELKRNGAAGALLYDSHEYWAGIGVYGRKSNDVLKEIEKAGIEAADYVITVNPVIAERLKEQYNLKETPSVVMNCPYRYEGELKVDSVFSPVRVVYQGKLQAFRGLAELVSAFEYIEGAKLTLSGYGPLEKSLKLLVKNRGLTDRVVFSGRYDPEETLPMLADNDIGVMPFRDVTLNMKYTSPNKLFDYAMAGLAVAASDLPFLSSTVKGYDMGRLFGEITPESIALILKSMISDTKQLVKYKNNGRKAALKTLCWEEQFRNNYLWRP